MFSLLLLFTLPFRSAIIIVGNVSIGRAAGITFGVAWTILVIRRGTVRRPHQFHYLIFIFTLWTALSTIWSVSVSNTLVDFIRFAYIFFTLVAIWDIYHSMSRVVTGLQVFLSAIVILLLGAYFDSVLVTTGLYESEYGARASPFGLNPNKVGSALVLGIPTAYFLNMYGLIRRNLVRDLNYAYLIFAPFGIFLTGSRAAIGGAIILLMFIIVQISPREMINKLPLAILSAFPIAFVIILVIPQSLYRRATSIIGIIYSGNVGSRGDIWAAGIEYFFQQPIIGNGSGNFIILVGMTAHNQYLTLLVELGLIGFILFLLAQFIIFRESLKSGHDNKLWGSIVFAWSLMLIFNDMVLITGLILMGVVIAGARLVPNKE